ncbi:MAG: sigma-54-dependent Fis family transcriptional regulator [Myxococcaceae bacterium]|nr:sigma-54-dependent Fis family transcriptional regulator [Myxococcaceae bacterium]
MLRLKARRAAHTTEVERLGTAVAASESMRRVFAALRQAARTNISVLLSGETGTGKEVLAHALHQVSPRQKAPFVVIDCASLGRDVIESELFGHVRGSFSGAVANRVGLLGQADKGTVFLDEIGELPLELQTRFLRVLVDGQIRAIGADKAVHVDLRVVAASHRDLRAMADAGQFRADLYYRLAGVVIELPPLRDRPDDLELLFSTLMDQEGHGDFVPTGELRAHLHSHRWPGNVRELKNFVQQVLAGSAPAVAGLNEEAESPSFKSAKEAMLALFTRQYFTQLYERCGGNVSEVARVSGLARPWVHQLITRLGIHETRLPK